MSSHPTIWIDLENTPHVPFFIPIILELERAGCSIILTARDFAQTKELVTAAGLNARVIGGEYGTNSVIKTVGILTRAVRLAFAMRGKRVSLAVGHGSRGLLLAARLLRIPTLTLYDYEGASVRLFNRLSDHVMTPELLSTEMLRRLGLDAKKHRTYPGLKEEVYVAGFTPDAHFSQQLNLDPKCLIVTVRPPSETAHYRSTKSSSLFSEIMTLLAGRPETEVIVTPRNRAQRESLTHLFAPHKNILVLQHAVIGLDLLLASDLVIGGGGTMNREAAVLGVPVVSIFKGAEGAVDASLERRGLLYTITQAHEVEPYLVRRSHKDQLPKRCTNVRDTIVRTILELAANPRA